MTKKCRACGRYRKRQYRGWCGDCLFRAMEMFAGYWHSMDLVSEDAYEDEVEITIGNKNEVDV